MRPHLVLPGDHEAFERLLRLLERRSGRVPKALELLQELQAADDYHAWIGSRYDILGRRTDISALVSSHYSSTPHARFVSESVTFEKKHRRQCSVMLHGSAIAHAVLIERDVEQVIAPVALDISASNEGPIEQINRLKLIGYDQDGIHDPLTREEWADATNGRPHIIMAVSGAKLRMRAESFRRIQDMAADEAEKNRQRNWTLVDALFPSEFEWDYASGSLIARRQANKK